MDTVKSCLSGGSVIDTAALLQACTTAELRFLKNEPTADTTEISADVVQLYSVHLCALLLAQRNSEARHLWARAPASLKPAETDTLFKDVWSCARALVNRDWATFFAKASCISTPPLVSVALGALVDDARARGVRRIEQCYTTIDSQTLCANLGMVESEVSQFCASVGWIEDTASGLIRPGGAKASKTSDKMFGSCAAISRANTQLEQLSMHVAHLEESITFKP